jgi:hypothetical protein
MASLELVRHIREIGNLVLDAVAPYCMTGTAIGTGGLGNACRPSASDQRNGPSGPARASRRADEKPAKNRPADVSSWHFSEMTRCPT